MNNKKDKKSMQNVREQKYSQEDLYKREYRVCHIFPALSLLIQSIIAVVHATLMANA